jgi:hypothetical protein
MIKELKYKLLFLKSYVVTSYKSHLQSECNVLYPDEVKHYKYDISTKNGDCLHKDFVFIQIYFLFEKYIKNFM